MHSHLKSTAAIFYLETLRKMEASVLSVGCGNEINAQFSNTSEIIMLINMYKKQANNLIFFSSNPYNRQPRK